MPSYLFYESVVNMKLAFGEEMLYFGKRVTRIESMTKRKTAVGSRCACKSVGNTSYQRPIIL